MSIWTHFTGGFGIDGIIMNKNRWSTIGNEINQLISPLPGDSMGFADPAKYKIKLHDPSCFHFADVLVSGDLRYVGTLSGIEKWLLMIKKRLEKKHWDIRCGCFFAYVVGQAPVIYYYDNYDRDSSCQWKKIDNVSGVLLQEAKHGSGS
jgi:hypothetical protein